MYLIYIYNEKKEGFMKLELDLEDTTEVRIIKQNNNIEIHYTKNENFNSSNQPNFRYFNEILKYHQNLLQLRLNN